jgi:hypothetical protein
MRDEFPGMAYTREAAPEPVRPKQMPTPAFLEIVLQTADFTFAGRDEIEDPLDEALQSAGLGEVTGGGGGNQASNIDVEVNDVARGLALIRQVLQQLHVAPSTVINQYEPERIAHRVYDHAV